MLNNVKHLRIHPALLTQWRTTNTFSSTNLLCQSRWLLARPTVYIDGHSPMPSGRRQPPRFKRWNALRLSQTCSSSPSLGPAEHHMSTWKEYKQFDSSMRLNICPHMSTVSAITYLIIPNYVGCVCVVCISESMCTLHLCIYAYMWCAR